ncbi:hypothetical protein [Endozoicomonas sp.]|uniref:hypothetical protein n=1 Tax=Endozoicomonas sp. TaxID=1892382 RepID=UPI00383BCD2B
MTVTPDFQYATTISREDLRCVNIAEPFTLVDHSRQKALYIVLIKHSYHKL